MNKNDFIDLDKLLYDKKIMIHQAKLSLIQSFHQLDYTDIRLAIN